MKRIISFFASAVLCASAFVSGGMPCKSANEVKYTADDLYNMRDFILKRKTADLTGRDYDLNGDGKWDVFDLCLLRQYFVKYLSADNDTLVVYFSCTGNTERIAEYLIESANADSYEIQPSVPYTDGDLKYNNSECRANKEQNDKTARPEIAEPIGSIDDYEVIYLGYPIWWGEEPRIIDTFLESCDFSDKIVIPFCTSGGSGISASEKNIANLAEIGSQLSGKRFPSGASEESVKEWADEKQAEIAEIRDNKKKGEYTMNITVGDTVLTAEMCGNSSAEALKEMLGKAPLTIDMHDYANFEKVGSLGENLPRNDEQITTEAGDIILYQGNQITIYYDKNTWNFTRLGKIRGVSQAELKKILGDGDVTVTLSLDGNK